jgi:hypothetical protein
MICGVVTSDAGGIEIDRIAVANGSRETRRRVGALLDHRGLAGHSGSDEISRASRRAHRLDKQFQGDRRPSVFFATEASHRTSSAAAGAVFL